ncbi:hypothetical protein AVEN_44949-1 [Araneus ventricosus]|uniref:Uncharacterized protein n=1 Tax=Araneus ventricosus TaxID=182803 RepID=A0A4Y2WUS7_ARAVE|nr:hypothetical protein AVEN_44949-1 [Araneus ventricosus]
MTDYGSVPNFVVSALISVAFGTIKAVKFIISSVSGVVSESTAFTKWSGEIALFRISCVSIGLACRASLDVKESRDFHWYVAKFISIILNYLRLKESSQGASRPSDSSLLYDLSF